MKSREGMSERGQTNTAWGGPGARRVSDTGRTDVPNTTGRSNALRIRNIVSPGQLDGYQ